MLVGGLEHVLFFHILGIIAPTDFHIFQRGRSTTNQYIYIYICYAATNNHHNIIHIQLRVYIYTHIIYYLQGGAP